MQFQIVVTYNRKSYRMQVEQLYCSTTLERFKVTGGGKSILLQSNRPLLQAKGLKHRKPQWKVLEGKITYWAALEVTTAAIEKAINNSTAKIIQLKHLKD